MSVTLWPPAGKEKCVLARAEAGVQNRPGDLIGHVKQCPLRLAGVPRGFAGVDGLECRTVGDGHVDL